MVTGPVSKLTLGNDLSSKVVFEYSDDNVVIRTIAADGRYVTATVPREAWGRVVRGETDR